MQKQLLILIILSVAVFAQDQTLAVSGDGSSSFKVEDGRNIIKDPPTAQSLISSPSSQSSSSFQKSAAFIRAPSTPSAPSDFRFIDNNSLGDNAKWVYANQKTSIGLWWLTTFTINYSTFCPNAVLLRIAASNIFRVFHNGVLVQGWSWPWPYIANINLSPSCQCNTITVQVYNFWYQSPGAIIYSLTQNTSGCFTCKLRSQFWNYQTCGCACKRNCCPRGQTLSTTSCECVRTVSSFGPISFDSGIAGLKAGL